MKQAIAREPEEIDQELSNMGLPGTAAIFERAVTAGYLARTGCTAHHPKTHPGTVHRAQSVCSLRNELVPLLGWKADCASNQELVVSPDGSAAIAVISGDPFTGTSKTPSTKYDSGTLARRFVAVNQAEQGELFPEESKLAPDGPAEKRLTWVLLSYIANNELRYELSLPTNVGENGFINLWSRRIIFPAIPIGEVGLPELPPHAKQQDVDIQLKS